MVQRTTARKGTAGSSPASLRTIVWLASYPKSGNTWARIFLANYLLGGDTPVPINQVHRVGIGDSMAPAYRRVAGGRYEPEDRNGHLLLRDRVLRSIAANGADINFVKTHNARTRAFGVELIQARFTRAAVYIIRDPLDVVVSYARHYAMAPSQAVEAIGRDDNTVAADATSVAQYLGNWSDHVRGWTGARDFPVHLMRYEDMKADPNRAFGGLVDFLGLPADGEKLDRAVRFSDFAEMKRQEEATPFVERARHGERFFHTGQPGQWRAALSSEDVARLRERHAAVMAQHGYGA